MPKVVPYTKGSVIFFAGDKDERIFILQSGKVVLKSMDIVTGELISENLTPGEFFGIKSALARRPRIETASATTDAQVVLLSTQEFERIFSANKGVISKMLTVFSKTLGDLYAKTELLLHYDRKAVQPEEGMAAVAKAFFDAAQYRSCVSECDVILRAFPETSRKAEIEKMRDEAENLSAGQAAEQDQGLGNSGQNESEKSALSQFSLPVFSRFRKEYSDGSVIVSEFMDPHHFYFIQSGKVQLKECINGTLKNLELLEAGNFFGVRAIISGGRRDVCCIAKGTVQCLEFAKENFNAIVRDNPHMSALMLKLLCKRIYDQRRQLSALSIPDLGVRIADVFMMYNELYYVPPFLEDGMEESLSRRFPLTVDDIACWAALSADAARDELNKYVSRNKLDIYDNYMIVGNIADMKRTVDSWYQNKDAAPAQPQKN